MKLAMALGLLLFTTGVGARRDQNENVVDFLEILTSQIEKANEGDPRSGYDVESVFDGQWACEKPFCQMFQGLDVLGNEGHRPPEKKPKLLVVGAGSAGLMAALEAHSGGADVAMVEKRTIGKFIRNNVLALDPMNMQKLEKIGVADLMFSTVDELPEYDDVQKWKEACVEQEDREAPVVHQDLVQCRLKEGVEAWGWGFIRTKCLENALWNKVKANNIQVMSLTEFVGMAIDEKEMKHYAVLRTFKKEEFILEVDGILLAVGSSVINQDKQEFRKWYVVNKACTADKLIAESKDCPEWLIKAGANQNAVKAKEQKKGKQWPQKSLEASDMKIMHKKAKTPNATTGWKHQALVYEDRTGGVPKGWEGLPSSDLGEEYTSLLVGIRDGENQACKNWMRKGAHTLEHKWKELTNREHGLVEPGTPLPDDSASNELKSIRRILERDSEFTKKFVWNLEYSGTKKQSYAMTGLFIPLKAQGKTWMDVWKNHVWTPGEVPGQGVFEELSNEVRGKNWLGNQAAKFKQQIRLFPNRCLVYVSVGLTNEKALELMSSTHAVPSVDDETRKFQCERAALDAGGCDQQTSAQASQNCDFLQSYHEVAPSCDLLTGKTEQADCHSQTKKKQIDFLKLAAVDAGLIGSLVPSSPPKGENWQRDQYHYTFFNINLFKLGPAPVSKEPLFLLGDAAHAPNFLAGCGVVGGQDDSVAVGHYSRWILNAGTNGWPSEEQSRQCTADMLKVVQNLVFDRSCKYSECHEHEQVSFVPEVPAHTVHGDERYKGKNTTQLAQLLARDCDAFMDKISTIQKSNDSWHGGGQLRVGQIWSIHILSWLIVYTRLYY